MAATEQSKFLGGLLALLLLPVALLFAGFGVLLALVLAGGLLAFLMIAVGVMKWKLRHGEATIYEQHTTTAYDEGGQIIEGESVVIEQHTVREPKNHA